MLYGIALGLALQALQKRRDENSGWFGNYLFTKTYRGSELVNVTAGCLRFLDFNRQENRRTAWRMFSPTTAALPISQSPIPEIVIPIPHNARDAANMPWVEDIAHVEGIP